MNTKSNPRGPNSSGDYAIIWFEGETAFTLVDSQNKTVVQPRDAVQRDTAGVIDTEQQLEDAEDDLRYAISVDLLENFFGWEV